MAVKTSWAAGDVLTAADLTDTFGSKADYALAQNTQTGTGASAYTFVLADASRLVLANAATAATYTIPPQASVAWVNNSIIQVTSIGAGVITFAGGAGVTVTNTAATLAQYQSAALIRTGSNAWTVVPFSGSGRATVSATTGSPTITTVSGKTCYQFTGSGTITIGNAGLCDILVVGGGGGGGANLAGGGGAGGYLYAASVYLPSGSTTVTVGAGGSGFPGGASAQGGTGINGTSSRIGPYYGIGGGGGGGLAYNTAAGASAGRAQNGGSGGGGVFTLSGASGDQGNSGGTGSGSANQYGGGGGGGSSAAGGNGSSSAGGNGGNGTANSITGSSVTYAGGGGGGTADGGTAGTGGSGGGAAGSTSSGAAGSNGTANTGGGGGGGGRTSNTTSSGGSGGSGIVIVLIG